MDVFFSRVESIPTNRRLITTVNADQLIAELLWRRLERFRLHYRSWKFHRHRLFRGQCTYNCSNTFPRHRVTLIRSFEPSLQPTDRTFARCKQFSNEPIELNFFFFLNDFFLFFSLAPPSFPSISFGCSVWCDWWSCWAGARASERSSGLLSSPSKLCHT